MRRYFILATLAVGAFAQSGPRNLGFEDGDPGSISPGWFGPKSINGFTVTRTTENPKSGFVTVITLP